MPCHIHPPPGRSSRHRTAGLTDSRQDSRGAFCNSFTGDAFSGTLRFILAGRGTAGQSRRCEMAARTRRYPRHESARCDCLAETSRIFMRSRSGFKLTKISCDIAATPARIRLIRLRIGRQQALCGFSSASKRGEPLSPSRQRSRRNTQRLCRCVIPHPAPGGDQARRLAATTIIFHTLTVVRQIIPPKYACLSDHFHRFRRSAKAFPFGFPGTRFCST
ncbi:hypothetical protein SAMN04487925_101624 [Bradyrhizobium sp. cf659]|nr:hypothetical protein SAMN04487925_101624 [Bradyrhizobium sp. cf659]